MLAAFVPVTPPVNPPKTDGADQLYNVPAGTIPFVPFTGVMAKLTPLQLTAVIAVIAANGLIVTVTLKFGLGPHTPGVGVTI